jgi:hypothetical protein
LIDALDRPTPTLLLVSADSGLGERSILVNSLSLVMLIEKRDDREEGWVTFQSI